MTKKLYHVIDTSKGTWGLAETLSYELNRLGELGWRPMLTSGTLIILGYFQPPAPSPDPDRK